MLLVSCTGNRAQSDLPPTATLAPIVSRTPRFTATPLSSSTPLPTFTLTPSITPIPPTPSDTPTPTATPPVTGIVSSLQTVNVREGPGTTFSAFVALNPGTGVEVIASNADGTWYNIRLESGQEGWIRSTLLRLEPTPTPFPTFTLTPDLTSLALGTPLPTALLGGGSVTPTPPRSVVTPTPPGTPAESADQSGTPTQPFLPVRDVTALYQTATALAGGITVITPRPNVGASPSPTGQSPNVPVTPASVTPGTASAAPPSGVSVQQGVDVFASCDNSAFGIPAPTTLAAGSTIDIFWAWFMSDPDLIDQHLNAVTYEVRINGVLLNWRPHGIGTRQQGDSFVKYWFVPYGPLAAGEYRITYRATWSTQITDGYEFFGPGTRNPVEEGSCTFTVR